MNLPEITQGMRRHFDITGGVIKFDGLISVLGNTLVVDMVAFDAFLHKRHGSYEDNGRSMRDVIFEEYGQAALLFAERVMGLTSENDIEGYDAN